MKKLLGFILIIVSITLQSQSSFYSGFKKGFCEGYKDKCGAYSSCPSAPSAPSPTAYQSLDSYTDGYNTGFKKGMNRGQRDCADKGSDGAYANPKGPDSNPQSSTRTSSYNNSNNNTELVTGAVILGGAVIYGIASAIIETRKENKPYRLWQKGMKEEIKYEKFDLSGSPMALVYFSQSISENPKWDGVVYLSRSANYFTTGKYEKALIDINKAHELSSSVLLDLDLFYADIYRLRGQIKFELKDYEGSVQDYKESLKNKANQETQELLNKANLTLSKKNQINITDDFSKQATEKKLEEKLASSENDISSFIPFSKNLSCWKISVTADKKFLILLFHNESYSQLASVYNFGNWEKLKGPFQINKKGAAIYTNNSCDEIYFMSMKKGVILNVNNLTVQNSNLSWTEVSELRSEQQLPTRSNFQKILIDNTLISVEDSYIKITPNQ